MKERPAWLDELWEDVKPGAVRRARHLCELLDGDTSTGEEVIDNEQLAERPRPGLVPQWAVSEAHSLFGSLGSFGLAEASREAGALEKDLLSSDMGRAAERASRLVRLILAGSDQSFGNASASRDEAQQHPRR